MSGRLWITSVYSVGNERLVRKTDQRNHRSSFKAPFEIPLFHGGYIVVDCQECDPLQEQSGAHQYSQVFPADEVVGAQEGVRRILSSFR